MGRPLGEVWCSRGGAALLVALALVLPGCATADDLERGVTVEILRNHSRYFGERLEMIVRKYGSGQPI